jgi:hypothetical protein
MAVSLTDRSAYSWWLVGEDGDIERLRPSRARWQTGHIRGRREGRNAAGATSCSLGMPSDFDDLVDLLRVRLGIADDLDARKPHSFRELMSDRADAGEVQDDFYWRAFAELEATNHLANRVSVLESSGDAVGRLSDDGRRYLRSIPWPTDDAA